MREDPIPPAVADRLSTAASRLQAARRAALDRVAVEETEWEYAGRTWSWPAGEARTYFHELAPGEREVLDELIAELEGLGEPGGEDETGGSAEVVGVGTGRVALAIPEPIAGAAVVAKLARYGPSAEMGAGRPQNRREQRVWSTVESHPFLPVLDGDDDGDWIAMPRASVPPAEAVRDEAIERVRTGLAPHRDRFHFDELKPENVGAYRGRFWIVDYGRPSGDPLFVDPPEAVDSVRSTDADATANHQDRSDEN